MGQYIVIGMHGVAMKTDDCEFINSWYQVPNSVPDATLYMNSAWESKDLGLIMKEVGKCEWEATEHPLIYHSSDKSYIKILCATVLTGIPQEVVINKKTQMQVTEALIVEIKTIEKHSKTSAN